MKNSPPSRPVSNLPKILAKSVCSTSFFLALALDTKLMATAKPTENASVAIKKQSTDEVASGACDYGDFPFPARIPFEDSVLHEQPECNPAFSCHNKCWPSLAVPGIVEDDPWLSQYVEEIEARIIYTKEKKDGLTQGKSLKDWALGHHYYGLQKDQEHWILREWAPNATQIFLFGEFNAWQISKEFEFTRLPQSEDWELKIPLAKLKHGDNYKLFVKWNGGSDDRLPAYTKRVVQNENTKEFYAQVWAPEKSYEFIHPKPKNSGSLLIYEAHVGMAQEKEAYGSYLEFIESILPRVKKGGYTAIQLMAIPSHPFYGSFGYHVANYFAPSSWFGTPEEFKHLVDEAHRLDLKVLLDITHSHHVANVKEGLSHWDGTEYQYFHSGEKGRNQGWGSRMFNYGKPQVLHFLLSNLHYWISEFHIDGYRFDGVNSMIYFDRESGFAPSSYEDYFKNKPVDFDALAYLTMANELVHSLGNTITIAEEVSGYPGMAAKLEKGGIGFDYRLAMGIPDMWFSLLNEKVPDNKWNISDIYYRLTNKREGEKVVSYVESHDQSLVGDKPVIMHLLNDRLYDRMQKGQEDDVIQRGLALHKVLRGFTATTAMGGYLNFIGNEFGHPEWVDFPREGNAYSFHRAKRMWSLADNANLQYQGLSLFDQELMQLIQKERMAQSQAEIRKVKEHIEDQWVVYLRAGHYIIVNLHPWKTQDITIDLNDTKKLTLVLNSDEVRFSGRGKGVIFGNLIQIPPRGFMVAKEVPSN